MNVHALIGTAIQQPRATATRALMAGSRPLSAEIHLFESDCPPNPQFAKLCSVRICRILDRSRPSPCHRAATSIHGCNASQNDE
jgi:hypothetical protein